AKSIPSPDCAQSRLWQDPAAERGFADASDAEVLAFPLNLVRVFVAGLVACSHHEVEGLDRGKLRGVERSGARNRCVCRRREVLSAGGGRLVDVVDDLA